MGDCCRCDAFRFFTPLRCVQNDRGKGAALRMTEGEGAALRMTGEGDGLSRQLWRPDAWPDHSECHGQHVLTLKFGFLPNLRSLHVRAMRSSIDRGRYGGKTLAVLFRANLVSVKARRQVQLKRRVPTPAVRSAEFRPGPLPTRCRIQCRILLRFYIWNLRPMLP